MTGVAKHVQEVLIGDKMAMFLAVLLTIVIAARRVADGWDPGATINETYVWFATVVAPYVLYRRLRNHFTPLDQKGEYLVFAVLCLGYAMFVFVIVQPF